MTDTPTVKKEYWYSSLNTPEFPEYINGKNLWVKEQFQIKLKLLDTWKVWKESPENFRQ